MSVEIKKAMEVLGYEQFTKVQEEVLPLLMENKNVIVKSKTGSGKTAAFAIAMLEKIDWDKKYPQALVLTCTRELAMQIKEEIALLGKYKKVKVQSVIGKENIENQKALLKQQCHVVVATPGRLLDLIKQDAIVLDALNMIVIDEADYMFELGFLEDVEKILENVSENTQTALFSATYPAKIETLIQNKIENPTFVEIGDKVQISHYYAYCDKEETKLYEMLVHLDVESAIVFCERKEEVKKISKFLNEKGVPVSLLHGDLLQKQRFEQLLQFKRGETNVLVASDVASRGIDVDKVSHVFHVGNITNVERYIHRCGRSARKDEKGFSILLIKGNNEQITSILEQFDSKAMDKYEVLHTNQIFQVKTKQLKQDIFDQEIEKIYINAGSEKKIRAGDIIGALCSLENITKDDIGVIEVLRKMSYVEIYHHKADYVVEQMKDKTIKKKRVKVAIAQ